jgi:cysteine desulfurase
MPVKTDDRIYLDWNATAPLLPEAREAVVAALELLGNPSSVHAEGRAARAVIEQAREQVAALVGAEPANVFFTSGGTEANALALTPHLQAVTDRRKRDRLLISAIEHASVRAGGQFSPHSVEETPVTPAGVIDLAALDRRLLELRAQGVRLLVSIMHANNETGVVQPIAAAAEIVHAAEGLLHVDAVQSVGKITCEINELRADLLTLSAHKLGGPKGVGALVRRSGDVHVANPIVKGGGQERGLRAGTENVPGIAGFGAAAAAAMRRREESSIRMAALRDRLERGLRTSSPGVAVFGAGAERLPNTTLFAVAGVKAETALIALDLDGIAVSSGSACSSGKVSASHVLAAMGAPAGPAAGAIRVSVGPTTGEREIDLFLKAWTKLALRLSRGRGGLAA